MPPPLLQETGNTFSHLGASRKPWAITPSVTDCSQSNMHPWCCAQKSDQSERAGRLTGSIFVPGMAANWFQQEAVVRHDQSDVRRRSGSSRRGTRGWWAVKSLKKKNRSCISCWKQEVLKYTKKCKSLFIEWNREMIQSVWYVMNWLKLRLWVKHVKLISLRAC